MMNCAMFFALVLLCMTYDFLSVSGVERCIEHEREALLEFKHGLADDSGMLSSWQNANGSKECCDWYGVRCDNTTGHVTELLLRGSSVGDYFDFENRKYIFLRGEISPALLELRHLNMLNLFGNDFWGYRIPSFIGSMTMLEGLNLSESGFVGTIPPELGNLTNLRTLDLSLCGLSGTVPPELGNLTNLRTLDLRDSHLSGTVPPELGNLTNLRTLYLSWNSLWFDNLNWLSHLSFLSELDLSVSNTNATNWIHPILELPSLEKFICELCPFTNTPPSTLSIVNSSTSLVKVYLSSNSLTSSIFDWLVNISTSLVHIDLSFNTIDGPIPDAFGRLNSLEYLDLSYNKIDGTIPDAFGRLNSLEYLDLSYNKLKGRIPESLGNFTHLKELRLSMNFLQGPLVLPHHPQSQLEIILVFFNSLEGTVSEADLENFHNLKHLDLSFNNLIVNISPNWIPPFQLELIGLANCEIGHSFPKWLQTQTNIEYIDLSYANISDQVPHWLWGLSPEQGYLNLSNNNIHGLVPDLSSKYTSVRNLDISFNSFSGPMPILHSNFDFLVMSHNRFNGSVSSICESLSPALEALDLSHNQFSGQLPNCWTNTTSLKALNLGNNQFFGKIPQSLSSSLRTLILRDNSFSGELPFTLGALQGLETLDVGANQLTGNIPIWIGTLQNVIVLILRENKFNGSIPNELCNLKNVQVLDLSRNNIQGTIPTCFNNFTELVTNSGTNDGTLYLVGFGLTLGYMSYNLIVSEPIYWKRQELEYSTTLGLVKLIDLSSNDLIGELPEELYNLEGLISLNFSRNRLSGKINPYIGQMTMLEVLDLSQNQLFGNIPNSLGELHFLSVLDLSNNNFSGRIPFGTQLQSFNESAYAGNGKLCGFPLPPCTQEYSTTSTDNHGDMKEEEDHVLISFLKESALSIVLGFIVAFWGMVYLLLFSSSCRNKHFEGIVRVADWMYVRKHLFLRRFGR